MKKIYYMLGMLLLAGFVGNANAQVSNDNEDGVNKVDSRFARDYVPGQVLVKFKDESAIHIQNNANGGFRAASINSIDELLKAYDVEKMEKLFPQEEAKPTSQLRAKRAPNGTMVKEKNLDKVFLLKMGEEKPMLELIEKLKAMPEVEYAEPNYRVYVTAEVPADYGTVGSTQQQSVRKAPVTTETTAEYICLRPSNNPLYFRQYGITQQNIHKLWDKKIKNHKRPVIAILDTGVDINHPDLAANIWTNTAEAEGETAYDDDNNGIVDDKYGWNFIDDYGEITDRNGHGTHVAGIAAAADNSIGIVGANPLALIMPVKVMNDRGVGDVATICRGIVYAAENGADIINMSFGHEGSLSTTEVDAIEKAYLTSILVASAGNNGASIYNPMDGPLWPAAYYLVLGVQATSNNGLLASFSNYDPDGPIYSEDGIDGRNHEIAVPGVDIYSTLPGGKYNKLSGTSMSAPLFAGAISALQMVKEYPSKDVLFGDLIHLEADFAKIYSDDTPRTPKIDLVSMMIDDNVEGNTNIDGQVDVGETIKFSPVLRNTWANATDINLRLTVDNAYKDFVTIQNPEVPFGYSISAYGRQTAETPFSVIFKNNIGDNTRIKFTLEVSYAESTESYTQDVYVTICNKVKISGLISEDRILTADHVYYVNENLGIMEGTTLTIEPGTRLEFEEGMGLSSYGKLVAKGTPEKPIVFTGYKGCRWNGISSRVEQLDTISYCKIEEYEPKKCFPLPFMKDCIVKPRDKIDYSQSIYYGFKADRTNVSYFSRNALGYMLGDKGWYSYARYCNIINCFSEMNAPNTVRYDKMTYCNYFNNYAILLESGKYDGKYYSLACNTSKPEIQYAQEPSYLGTSRQDIIRPFIYEIGNAPNTYGQIDLSNMPTRPYAEAHGIVWKVVVNGKDTQDEYEDLAPLGVGKQKF